jgi:hypothetical protein
VLAVAWLVGVVGMTGSLIAPIIPGAAGQREHRPGSSAAWRGTHLGPAPNGVIARTPPAVIFATCGLHSKHTCAIVQLHINPREKT